MATFDRDAAKAAGYTDAEIDAYLQQGQGSAEGRTFEYGGAPDLPLERDPFSPFDIPAAFSLGRLGVGLLRRGVPVAGRFAGRGVLATGRAIGRRALGRENFRDLVREILPASRLARGAQEEARVVLSRPPGAAASRVAEPDFSDIEAAARSAGRGAARAEGQAVARVKPVRPPKGKPKPGSAASRIKPRGASGPELERRAAARKAAIGREPSMGDDLESQLMRSLQLEDEMNAMGLSDIEKQAARLLARARMFGS